MVRIQDFHSWHTSSILVESTIKQSPVTTGMIINLKGFTIMSKNKKELSQVKARQTKLGKKGNEELIQIILKKDKIERNLNNQIKSLKGEVNALSTRVNNFDSDMAGTYQSLESYKDKCNTLLEKNDALILEKKETTAAYESKVITLTNKVGMWKFAAYVTTAIAVIAIIVAIL